MRRHIHYESAFEDFLRARGLPYVAVDETRRAIFRGSRIKSFDFLVYRPAGPHWLADVKGRKFPYDTAANRRCWENWVTSADLEDLAEWQRAFGEGFRATLVFAYWMTGPTHRWPFRTPHVFRGEHYAFLAADLEDYRRHCRPRSASWDTVTVPAARFREMVTPV